MTEHKFTDDEKILALLKVADDIYANAKLTPEEAKTLLDLIKRYKAEIERLEEDNKIMGNVIKNTFLEKVGIDIDPLAEIKAEAIKEFAERLKNCRLERDDYIIDNLVKEMTEGKE